MIGPFSDFRARNFSLLYLSVSDIRLVKMTLVVGVLKSLWGNLRERFIHEQYLRGAGRRSTRLSIKNTATKKNRRSIFFLRALWPTPPSQFGRLVCFFHWSQRSPTRMSFFYTAAAFADGESQTECEVHAAAVDGNPLGGVFGNQNVGADKKVDPVGADVHAYAYCAAVSALEGVASREGKPAGRRKVDRSRDAVEVFYISHRRIW